MKSFHTEKKMGFKRFICLLLVMLTVFTPVTSTLPGANIWGMETTAEAADKVYHPKQPVYFKKYTGKKTSFVDALKEIGADSSYANRKYIASKNGISNYSGTAAQNSTLLKLLKKGKLDAGWEISCPELVTAVSGREHRVKIRLRGSGISSAGARTSNGDVLKLRVEGDWKARYEWSTIYVTVKVKGNHLFFSGVNIIFYEDGNGSVMNAHREKKIPVIILGNG